MNVLARSKGIKVINLDSFQGIHDQFPWPEDIYRPLAGHRLEFCNFCDANKFPKEPRGHYFIEAHQAYAQFANKKINKSGVRFND